MATAGGGRKPGGGGGGGKLKFILAGVVGLGLIGGLIAWVISSSSPAIHFSVQPTLINAGQTATLKWSVEHAADVSIDPGLGPVQTEDTLPVSPRGTTTYTLTAKSGSQLATKSVTLQVNGQLPAPIPGPVVPPVVPPVSPPVAPPIVPPRVQPRPAAGPPVIQSLTVTPAVVQVGQSTLLRWSTRNTRSVSLPGANPPRTNLPSSGRTSITPRAPGVINIVLVGVGDATSVQRAVQLTVVAQRGPAPPSPGPGTQPFPRPNDNSQPDSSQEQEPPRSAPASGMLIWEGDVQGTQLVRIQNGVASPGQLISGRLPGVAVILQQQNEKKVGIASAPSPDNGYQRLVLRVFGHGHTRVVVNWSTP